MLKDTIDGIFTTIDDIAATALFLAAFPSAALTGQSIMEPRMAHGVVVVEIDTFRFDRAIRSNFFMRRSRMEDAGVMNNIQRLVAEEHKLFEQGSLNEVEQKRLASLEVELDQCWDLLRQPRSPRVRRQPR